MQSLANVLSYAAMLVPLLPALAGLLRWAGLAKGQRLFLALCIFYLLIQIIAEVLLWQNISNMPLYHLTSIVECVVFTWVFQISAGTWHHHKLQVAGSVAVVVLGLVLGLFVDGIGNPPGSFLTIESILLILTVGAYFFKVYAEMHVARIEREFLFWISIGLLVSYAGSLLLSVTLPFIIFNTKEVFMDVFLIRTVLILLSNLCFFTAMLCREPIQK